jgi:hypothetical protein
VLCPACRERLQEAARLGAARGTRQPLCFQCYRAHLDRERALESAGRLETASDARFQFVLPLEPVNKPRLAALQAARATARVAERSGAGRFVERRRQAQIAARHALQAIGAGLKTHTLPGAAREQLMVAAIHAAELQLPESWLPFVVSR